MTSSDEQEVLRLFQLMLDSACQSGVDNLNRYIHPDFVSTGYSYEHDKKWLATKEQVIARWGSQTREDGTATPTEQRVVIAGNTAIVNALIVDQFPDGKIIRTWISDVWVKQEDEWRWLASHESALK